MVVERSSDVGLKSDSAATATQRGIATSAKAAKLLTTELHIFFSFDLQLSSIFVTPILFLHSHPELNMVNAPNGVSKETFLFTSESVGEGHPDKIA